LGAVAHIYFEDSYEWHNIYKRGFPFVGKVIQSWSHGGLNKKIKPGNVGGQAAGKSINTPRKLFANLGLLETKERRTLGKMWRQFMDACK